MSAHDARSAIFWASVAVAHVTAVATELPADRAKSASTVSPFSPVRVNLPVRSTWPRASSIRSAIARACRAASRSRIRTPCSPWPACGFCARSLSYSDWRTLRPSGGSSTVARAKPGREPIGVSASYARNCATSPWALLPRVNLASMSSTKSFGRNGVRVVVFAG